ncbi:hypothetical protein Taro_026457 [Colocasia esculenta]|uniref:Dolichyl-diphosphooligosaccharide--protein glycosyltransferase subunit DAD1 n=1 Tax=Colocasia esculenta TaxID=4460 RepID=A0A843VF89_COLES|nr:hypothetical protein [Colocasia esculenta]
MFYLVAEIRALIAIIGADLCCKSDHSGRMGKSTTSDAQALIRSLCAAYSATPTNLKIIDLYVIFAVFTAVVQVHVLFFNVYRYLHGNSWDISLQLFPLRSAFLCRTAVLAVCLRIQVNKENKEFKDRPPERAFADFVLCNMVLHLVITNFLG